MNTDDKLKLVDPSCSQLSVSRQCRLLALSRSRFYYKPKGIDEVELEQMRILDELYLEDPIRGTRRMSKELKKLGYQCGRQQIEEAISKNGDNQIRSKFYGYMADCLGILGFHHDAIEKHNKSIALDPDDCNNYYMRSISKGQILDHECIIRRICTQYPAVNPGSKGADISAIPAYMHPKTA